SNPAGLTSPNGSTPGWKTARWPPRRASLAHVAAATKSVGMLHFTPAPAASAVSRKPRLSRATGGAQVDAVEHRHGPAVAGLAAPGAGEVPRRPAARLPRGGHP